MGKSSRFYADIMAMHDEVTGSSHLVIVKFPNGETMRFNVDCGLFQEKDYDVFNNDLPFNAENLDFSLVTHVHVDHIGRLPFMVKQGFYRNIYATKDTCKLLPIALKDSFSILNSVAKRKHINPLYNEGDVDTVCSLLVPCEFEETIQVNNNTKVTFFQNGHLMGASIILVQISYPSEEDINILFTGDYNNKNVFFDVNPIPEWVLKLPLTIVQESTYGNMDSTEMVKQFTYNVERRILKGGTVVAMAFSLGRVQEILYELKMMQINNQLSTDIPIYLDGKLSIRYTEIYMKGEVGIKKEMLNFLPENLMFVDKKTRCSILEDNATKIIVTSSGMGSYGPAQVYIPEYITHRNALIHFTGYTAEGTLGARLKNAERGEPVEIGGLVAIKRADVEYTTEYSAHAKADEMIEFLKTFKNLKLVLINHGEKNTKEIFAKRVLKEIDAKRVGILNRQYLFRIDSYGLVKTLSTKFE